ncbi:chromatin accessibility complex 16kD protein [Danaus plexippus]|uniref:Chromatin accessibility complex protein 1 n=1 Tax=Danaus plexippus plexippus TaxID=278856 RepID=A0A212EKT0_DANPL|nr:chromatin accessibility complex 16kD protein [Danaus plexippus]OWR42096.1 chromatin accessibility complex protein 1 [Danaus plexippus plexippus]
MATPKAEKDLHLPLSRVKTIMKSSPEVDAVGPEPLYLVTKVTELFVTDLAKRAYKNSEKNFLEYKHIAEVVQQDDTLDFLREIMPRKITVRQFKEMMAKKAAKANDSDETSEESSEEESSDESSSGNSNSNQDNKT